MLYRICILFGIVIKCKIEIEIVFLDLKFKIFNFWWKYVLVNWKWIKYINGCMCVYICVCINIYNKNDYLKFNIV